MMSLVAKVLIIEDDGVIAQGMARHLAAAGFDPVEVGNGGTGLARLRFERPDVCVLDLMLPGLDGWKLIQTARDELLQKVWGRRAGHRDRTVDVFVRKLREKVDRRAPKHTFIQTRFAVGYKLDPQPKIGGAD